MNRKFYLIYMKKFILIIGLLLLALTVKASYFYDYSENLNYCDWMSNAAYIVAQNRDIGIEEYKLIGKYIEQDGFYDEQVIVINLIDHIYGSLKDKNAYNIKLKTESECLGTIFSYMPDETFQ